MTFIPTPLETCVFPIDPHATLLPADPRFNDCLATQARVFLEVDYVETKDLAKAFLTLMTAVLVASITFSEKIVNLNAATWWAKTTMVSSWLFLLMAIAACGTGLTFMIYGAYYAAHAPWVDYLEFGYRAGPMIFGAGILFGLALASLLVAGMISLLQRDLSDNIVPPSPIPSVSTSSKQRRK